MKKEIFMNEENLSILTFVIHKDIVNSKFAKFFVVVVISNNLCITVAIANNLWGYSRVTWTI